MRIELTPVQYPVLSFLGKDVLEEARECLRLQFPEESRTILDKFIFYDGVIKGSNIPGNILLSRVSGIQLAYPSQLEHAVRISPDYFKETYEDTAFMLREDGDPNSSRNLIARDLYRQLKKRGIKPTPENPARISLAGTILRSDRSMHLGIGYDITEETDVVQDSRFSYLNNERRFKITDEQGVPIFDSEGTRVFCTKQGGLSRFYFGRVLILDSNWKLDRCLSDSNADGRVAVVENFSSGNLDEYLARLSEEKDRQIAEVDNRYEQAMAIMRG